MDTAEINDILVSVIAISFAFTLARTGGLFRFLRGNVVSFDSMALLFVVSAFTVGLGFVLHELAHKFMAMRYGCRAAYRAWPMGLQLALITSLFGFVFAAPGATYIYTTYLSRHENGIISLVGPLTNAALVFIFLILSPFVLIALPQELARLLIGQGIMINLWLAFFNMLPFGPLDGGKFMEWNSGVWLAVTAGIFVLMFF